MPRPVRLLRDGLRVIISSSFRLVIVTDSCKPIGGQGELSQTEGQESSHDSSDIRPNGGGKGSEPAEIGSD